MMKQQKFYAIDEVKEVVFSETINPSYRLGNLWVGRISGVWVVLANLLYAYCT